MKIENPKYESPIEEKLAAEMASHFRDEVRCSAQRPMRIGPKQFRVDFQLEAAGKTIIVEADGRDFHDYRADRARDLWMHNEGGIDAVFRFRGCDIFFNVKACAIFLSDLAPFLIFADGHSIGAGALELAASSVIPRLIIKPIVRLRMDLEEVYDHRPALESLSSIRILGRTNDGKCAIIQAHTAGMNDRYSGDHIWKLGDYIAFKNRNERGSHAAT